MASTPGKKNSPNEFTFEMGNTGSPEAPQLTNLFEKKNLNIPSGSEKTEIYTPPSKPQKPSLQPPKTVTYADAPAPVRRKGTRKPRQQQQLVAWEIDQIKDGTDPLGKGLAIALEKGAKWALFLSITDPPPNSPVPHFLATAAIAPKGKQDLWTGLKWDPMLVPELWNIFVRTGLVELSPPGASTNIRSNRNVVRGAFGVSAQEWLLLVRAGPASDCRGVLAIISERGIVPALKSAIDLISQPVS